ncbi:MAG: hypothetical protein RLZZ238_1431 [Planctomycetota bacterium]
MNALDRRLPGRLSAVVATCALALTSAAFAGPDWDEGATDAGSTVGTAQVISTTGSVNSITGKLGGPGLVAGDFQDCFLIQITDPTNFSLTTGPGFSGPPGFDPMMFLFRVDLVEGRYVAKALIANNDLAPGNVQAGLSNSTNDGSNVTVRDAGLYLIAISGFGSQPVNASGQFLFNQAFLQPGIFGGPALEQGMNDYLLAGWSSDGSYGNYVMNITGVSGVPAPGAIALLALGGLAARRRR